MPNGNELTKDVPQHHSPANQPAPYAMHRTILVYSNVIICAFLHDQAPNWPLDVFGHMEYIKCDIVSSLYNTSKDFPPVYVYKRQCDYSVDFSLSSIPPIHHYIDAERNVRFHSF